jgi:hypothetical protein
MAPQVGLEPTTLRLTAERSSPWDGLDYLSQGQLVILLQYLL